MKSKEKYIPPYKVSEEAVNLIAEISAAETDKKTNKKTNKKILDKGGHWEVV